MNNRRGFLALVGGALLSGSVLRRATAETPTLILPPALVPVAPARPLLDAMLDGGQSQMHAILDIGLRMPKPAFLDWLEDGLQRAALHPPRDKPGEERRIRAAVAQHGSLIAAVRAGAL